MALKNIWQNKVDDVDYIVAEDINDIAAAVIELEENQNSDTYTKAEIDEKFKNLYYTEDVKLTDVTTVNMGMPDELIKDDVLIPLGVDGLAAETLFHIDVNGYIKFHCEIEEGGSLTEINGTFIGGETGIYEYSFEGEVTGGFYVSLTSSSVTFTEFIKKTYVKDAIGNVDSQIGDIDTALDELHNYAEALKSGGEA